MSFARFDRYTLLGFLCLFSLSPSLPCARSRARREVYVGFDWVITLAVLFFCLITTTIVHPPLLLLRLLRLFLSSLFYHFCALSRLDSCDERAVRTDVDDNNTSEQEDVDDEIIKNMKYDFLSLSSSFPRFCSFSLSSIYCFIDWVNSEEASSIISRNRDPFLPLSLSPPFLRSLSLSLLLTKPIVYVCMFCVHDRIFLFFSPFTYANQCMHAFCVSVCALDYRSRAGKHVSTTKSSPSPSSNNNLPSPLGYLSDEWKDVVNARRTVNAGCGWEQDY